MNTKVHEKIDALLEQDYQSIIDAQQLEKEAQDQAAYERGQAEMQAEPAIPETEQEWITNPPEGSGPEMGDGSGEVALGHVPQSIMDLFNNSHGLA